ncbi:hypothetical protein LWI28_009365 [Acer negundo]|uniref:Uncharacterized protein n=1 Tax=Acer negundo TaxID=4023 RepID=A0AAD5ILW7_ACENE|nr:hypothetical protein LWI28_009365 [Acer negundo]
MRNTTEFDTRVLSLYLMDVQDSQQLPNSQSTPNNNNPFIPFEQIQNHFASVNCQYPPNLTTNPMNSMYLSQTQQQFGPRFSHMNTLNLPSESQNLNLSKISKKKKKERPPKIPKALNLLLQFEIGILPKTLH